jgi:hypothetical protein
VKDADNTVSADPNPYVEDLAWLLVGGGALGGLFGLMRGRTRISDWLIPLGLTATGIALLLRDRRTSIEEAEERVQADLEALDPFARAQVLAAILQREFGS